MGMDNLHDYFIHFNKYTKEWNAVKRDVSNQYFNGTLKPGEIFKHKDFNQLVSIIINK